MDKELVELFEAAKKAADSAAIDGVSSGGPEVSRCVDALKQLKSFPVTYDILVSTQVGKRLRPLTKHPREKIQIVASNLLDIWKKIVIEETTRNKKNGSTDNKSSVTVGGAKPDTGPVEKVQKTSAVKVEKVQKTSSVKVEKVSATETVKVDRTGSISRSETVNVEKKETNGGETVKVEKLIKEEKQAPSVREPSQGGTIASPKLTQLVKCNDPARDKIRELLLKALSKVSDECPWGGESCDPIRVAVSVESVMFEKLGRSNGVEKQKYRSILFNMNDANNPDLRRRVLLGEVKPERLITMAPEEMASDERKREYGQIKEKALNECERGQPQAATTDQFKCSRCLQRKCTYYQMQTRSADEPMTTYVTCTNCNKRWKFC